MSSSAASFAVSEKSHVDLCTCASHVVCSRTLSLDFVQASRASIPLSIQLPDVPEPQFLLAEGEYVGQVVDAINAKFNRLKGVTAEQVQLYKLGDDGTGSRTPLHPMQTLSEAGIISGTKLVLELTAVTTAGLSGWWE
jgi:hypothetical protein